MDKTQVTGVEPLITNKGSRVGFIVVEIAGCDDWATNLKAANLALADDLILCVRDSNFDTRNGWSEINEVDGMRIF